jgi:hypothetical protein
LRTASPIERVGPIAQGARSGAERGHEVGKRVAHQAPPLQNALEVVLLEQDLDAFVLLIEAIPAARGLNPLL